MQFFGAGALEKRRKRRGKRGRKGKKRRGEEKGRRREEMDMFGV